MGFVQFMSSTTGRVLRIVAGLALIVTGFTVGGGWIAMAIVGFVPLLAGLAGVCLFAPLLHQPLKHSTTHATHV